MKLPLKSFYILEIMYFNINCLLDQIGQEVSHTFPQQYGPGAGFDINT